MKKSVIITITTLFILSVMSLIYMSKLSHGSLTRSDDLNTTTIEEETDTHFFLAFLRTTFPDQIQLIDLYQDHLSPGDYVSTISSSEDPNDNQEYLSLLPGTSGVTFYSLAQIKDSAESLKNAGIQVIGYDLEGYSPSSDLLDPVESMRSAAEIAHQNGLKFLAVPGYPVDTVEATSLFAPYADIYIIQAQPEQSDPDEYKSFVTDRVNVLKAANPNITILTELSTEEENVSNMIECFSLVADYVDGVTIWYENEDDDLSRMKDFLEWFEQNYK